MMFFKPFIRWKKEMESKSSPKWLSDFSTDDSFIDNENKVKRNPNSKFSGYSMPHISLNRSMESEQKSDGDPKLNMKHEAIDLRSKDNSIISFNTEYFNNNLSSKEPEMYNVNDCMSSINNGGTFQPNSQSYHGAHVTSYMKRNKSPTEHENIPENVKNSTEPETNYKNFQNSPENSDGIDLFLSLNLSSIKPKPNYYPRSTCSVASLDTALLLQDTETLLNDMEKRVYSRREIKTSEELSRVQSFATSFPQSQKMLYLGDGEEKEGTGTIKRSGAQLNNSHSMETDIANRSHILKSPKALGIIRRENSCKVGISGSLEAQTGILGRKLNSAARTQRSCSLIEELKSNYCENNTNFVNLQVRVNGYISTLNGHNTNNEPNTTLNSSFTNHKSKDTIPYLSNLLSVHRQKFNRYEYGQHSLKYSSNSTTMLYNKYNNISPPWNGDDAIYINNLAYSNYNGDYYSYNALPEAMTESMLFVKHQSQLNMKHHHLNIDTNADAEFQREESAEYNQLGNISGKSSAFSSVNSLHHSNESVNNSQMTNKSRSSLGFNEQKFTSYDFLLVSSIHLYSARLCRYTEEIVHRLRREDPDCKESSPNDLNLEKFETFDQLKLSNRELREILNNLRSLEKQLQKIEKFVFPPEKSGRNSTLGSCTENSYLDHLERINKELEDFVPIDDEKVNKISALPKISPKQEYPHLKKSDAKSVCQMTISKDNSKAGCRTGGKLDHSIKSTSTSDMCSPAKSKYSSLSKRFQNRKN